MSFEVPSLSVHKGNLSQAVQNVASDEVISKSDEDLDVSFQDLASLETSLEQGASNSSSVQLSFPVDPHHAEIHNRFYTMLEIPVGDISKGQLIEFTCIMHKHEEFSPSPLMRLDGIC